MSNERLNPPDLFNSHLAESELNTDRTRMVRIERIERTETGMFNPFNPFNPRPIRV